MRLSSRFFLRALVSRIGSGLRLAARGGRPALGAFLASSVALLSTAAGALPVAVLNTGGCVTSVVNNVQTCQQTGGAGTIFSQANLDNLSATASLDVGPYAFTARASVIYYFSITSSGAPFTDWVPLTITASGNTAVGNSGSAIGGAGFNHNTASANIRLDSTSIWSACSGYNCAFNEQPSFSGTRTTSVRPYSAGSDMPAEFQIALTSSVSTNANYERSFAYAYVDPIIGIDPAFLAQHPGLTLSFSEGVPTVPLPGSMWLLAGGMLGLIETRRRQRR